MGYQHLSLELLKEHDLVDDEPMLHHCCVSCGFVPLEGMKGFIQLHGDDVECLLCKAPLIPPRPEVARMTFFDCNCCWQKESRVWMAAFTRCPVHPSHEVLTLPRKRPRNRMNDLTFVEPGIGMNADGQFFAIYFEARHGPYDTMAEAAAVRESLEKSDAVPCDGLGEV